VQRRLGQRLPLIVLVVFVILTARWFFFSKQILPAPAGVSERYVLHVGPTLIAGVEDTATHEIVLWFDMDAGPDLKRIERLPNGDWSVILTPRSHGPTVNAPAEERKSDRVENNRQ
jgi:hypothetical protein